MKKVPYRYLKSCKTTRTPSNLLFLDTETTGEPCGTSHSVHFEKLRLGVASALRLEDGRVTRRAELVFHKPQELWKFVASRTDPRRPLWVIAHNWSFDSTTVQFWKLLEKDRFNLKFASLETGSWICKGTFGGGTVWLVDLFNYFRQPLSEIGKWVGIEKLHGDPRQKSEEDAIIHCRRDVQITESAFLKLLSLVHEHDLGVFKPTASGIAMSAYKHRFMDTPLLIHQNQRALEIERESYYSGLNLCFYLGHVKGPEVGELPDPVHAVAEGAPVLEGPVTVLDVNSMYASVMRDGHFPTRIVRDHYRIPKVSYRRVVDKWLGIAEVKVSTSTTRYPVRVNGRTFHARGEFWTRLAGAELEHAVRNNHVVDSGWWICYESERIFTRYVDTIWELRNAARASGDTVANKLWKLFLNGLYGKFGQRGDRWKWCPELDNDQPWGESLRQLRGWDEPRRCRWLGWKGQVFEERPSHLGSIPSISTCVTAAGRRKLWEIIDVCPSNSVLYCDTDSVHVLPAGARALADHGLVDQGRLGSLKVEGVYQNATYAGEKVYWLDGEPVIAGIKRDHALIDGRWYEFDLFEHNGGIKSGSPTDGVKVSKVRKRLSFGTDRGITRADGRVEPLWLGVDDAGVLTIGDLRPEQVSE